MALASIPKLPRKATVNYRRWLAAGKGRAQATALARSNKSSRRTP